MKIQERDRGATTRRRARALFAHGALFAGLNAGFLLWLTQATMQASEGSALWVLGLMSSAEIATQLLICALLQGVLVAGVSKLRVKRAERVLRAARGTVITETLIVMLPFMLLMSGLAQMTMNNMAGILTNYAAYQAGRAVWVNEPHPDSSGKSQERARLAAAMSVAPVATGSMIMAYNGPAALSSARATMFTTFSPLAGFGGFGALAGGSANKMPATAVTLANVNTVKSFDSALDNDSFGVRAARKLTFAHACMEVTVINGGEVGATVKYSHYQAFPWFGWITGSFGAKGGRPGYYSLITRTYTLPAQAR